jgi:hypothetical protein
MSRHSALQAVLHWKFKQLLFKKFKWHLVKHIQNILVSDDSGFLGCCIGEDSVKASRLHRILSQENKTYLGCIKLPSGGYTESVEKSLGHLLDVHFPGSWGPSSGLGEGPMIEGAISQGSGD